MIFTCVQLNPTGRDYVFEIMELLLLFFLHPKPKSFVCIFLFDFIVIRKRVAISFSHTSTHFGYTERKSCDIVEHEQLQLYCHFSFNIHLNFAASQSYYFMFHCYVLFHSNSRRTKTSLKTDFMHAQVFIVEISAIFFAFNSTFVFVHFKRETAAAFCFSKRFI